MFFTIAILIAISLFIGFYAGAASTTVTRVAFLVYPALFVGFIGLVVGVFFGVAFALAGTCFLCSLVGAGGARFYALIFNR